MNALFHSRTSDVYNYVGDKYKVMCILMILQHCQEIIAIDPAGSVYGYVIKVKFNPDTMMATMRRQTTIVGDYIGPFLERLIQLHRSGDGTVAVAIKILFCAHNPTVLKTLNTTLRPGKPIIPTQRVLHEIELTRKSAEIGTGPLVVETAITKEEIDLQSGQYLTRFLEVTNFNIWVKEKFTSAALSFHQFLLEAEDMRAICACRRVSSARRCRRCWSSRDSPGSVRWPKLKSSMNAAATADGSSSRTCSVMTSACS